MNFKDLVKSLKYRVLKNGFVEIFGPERSKFHEFGSNNLPKRRFLKNQRPEPLPPSSKGMKVTGTN